VVTQKFYQLLFTVMWMALMVFLILDARPWEYGWSEVFGLMEVGLILLGVFALLSWSDRFARRNDIGEAKFDTRNRHEK